MKDYHEVAENVFRRRDEYEVQKAARRQRLQKITTSLSVFAIAVAFLFTAGTCYVFAVGLGIVDDTLGICDNFFAAPITSGQRAVVENAAVELGDIVACNGFAVTAKSAFTDGTTVLILLEIIAPENIDLNHSALHFNMDWRGIIRGDNPSKRLGAGDSGATFFPQDDQDGAKNTKEILIRVDTIGSSDGSFSFADGYDRYLTLEGIYAHQTEYPYTEYLIAEGNWNFRIRFEDTFSNEKEMLDHPINLTIRRAMYYDVKQTATIHSIVVKGLSVRFRYTYGADAVQEPGTFDDLKIILTDGTVINAREGMGVPGENGEFITTFMANAPILAEDIDYIQIGDTMIAAN